MNSRTKQILKHVFIPIGFGLVVGVFLTWFSAPKNILSRGVLINNFLYSAILSLLFWKGNEFIIKALNKRYSWIKETRKIVILHLLVTFAYNIIVITSFYLYIWFGKFHKQSLTGFLESTKGGFYMCLSITIIVTLISYAYNFFQYWKKSVLKEEELKRERIILQYEALKNQVNPHFLFNSLNVLTSLIELDKDASIKYVKQLSEVMRYVLDKNSTELVPIDVELKFIESFVYLLKIRFGNNLKVQVNIGDRNFCIVPVALQILIENAVKHNEVSADKPLYVDITEIDDYLIVSNNIQERNYLPDSNFIGLKSLTFQYEFLSGRQMEIVNNGTSFVVKIPKIKQ
ncbi:MAG TPA: histidine kinase [Bacteroidales bacterium]|nr:histidine kinase [Bacteroidales bacterium]